MKGTGAKRNVCPGSCVSTGAKFPVAPVESAPMVLLMEPEALCLRLSVRQCVRTGGGIPDRFAVGFYS